MDLNASTYTFFAGLEAHRLRVISTKSLGVKNLRLRLHRGQEIVLTHVPESIDFLKNTTVGEGVVVKILGDGTFNNVNTRQNAHR